MEMNVMATWNCYTKVVNYNIKYYLKKYGGGKDLPKVSTFFNNNQVEPNSKDGYRLMKEAFKKFRYQYV